MTTPTLTPEETAMLQFAKLRWTYQGTKEDTIRTQFGCSPSIFYARLNRLLDNPAALAAEPVLVRALTRLRDARRHQRSAHRIAQEVR